MLIDQILALPPGSIRVADIGAAFYGHYVFNSPDLAARCMFELQNRSSLKINSAEAYLQTIR